MSRIHLFSLVAALATAPWAGCDEPQPGVAGNIQFTPTNCGLLSCDFDDAVGVGGVIEVRVAGIGDFDAAGVTLESNNSEVLGVTYLGVRNGNPTWELEAMAPGQANLIARRDRVQVDTIEVRANMVTNLLVRPFLTDIDVQQDIFGYDYYVLIEPEQNELVSLYMIPAVGEQQVMGRYEYLYEIVDADEANEVPDYGAIDPEFATYIENLDELDNGRLTFTVPANAPPREYRATFAPVVFEEDVSTRIGIGITPAP